MSSASDSAAATPPATTATDGTKHAVTEDLFIGIAGIIGAGKSTLARSLAQTMGLPVYYEPVNDHEYLADFYTDMKKYSFSMQVYLLNRRFQQHQQIIWQGRGGVQDRTIYEDSVFAKVWFLFFFSLPFIYYIY